MGTVLFSPTERQCQSSQTKVLLKLWIIRLIFSNFWAPSGLSRKGSLVQGKAFLARGLLLCPASISCSYSACHLFIPQTYIEPPFCLAISGWAKSVCGLLEWVKIEQTHMPFFSPLLGHSGTTHHATCFHCLAKSSQLPRRWFSQPCYNSEAKGLGHTLQLLGDGVKVLSQDVSTLWLTVLTIGQSDVIGRKLEG